MWVGTWEQLGSGRRTGGNDRVKISEKVRLKRVDGGSMNEVDVAVSRPKRCGRRSWMCSSVD